MATIQGSCSLNPTKYAYYAEWSESDINIVNNTSVVTVNVYVQKIGNYDSEGSNNSNTLYIDGQAFTTSGLYIDMNPETTPRLVASGSKTITHNSDGSKSITISASGTLPYGNGYGPQSGSLSATVSLTTIPREAYITNSVDFTLGNNIPLTIWNGGSQYVQSLLYVNGTLIKTTNHGQVTSATITPTSGEVDSMYAQIPSATSCAMYVRIKTYSDSGYTSQIGSNKDKTGTMSINQTTNKPTFTDFAVANLDKNVANTDKYSNVLVTSSTSTLLGSDAKVIKGYSKLRATVSVANKMVALNSATAVKYRFSAGSLTKDENYSAVADVTLDIDNVLTKDVSVTAYDSRNLTTSVSKSLSYLAEYTPVSLWGLAFVRDNSVDSKTKLQVSGSFWKQYFGGGTSGVLNSVTAHYRYKLTTESWASQTWTAITLTDDGSGNLSFDDYIEGDLGASGFDSDKSFDIEVRLYDKLSNVIVEATLSKGIPVMDITQDGVAFGGVYDSTEGGKVQVESKDLFYWLQNSKYRQAIINGNFDIWQRGTSFSGAVFTADRWYGNLSGATGTFSRQAFTVGQTDVPNNPTYFMRWQCTGADDNMGIFQYIEDVNTFAGMPCTVSFWGKADATRTVKCHFTQHFGTGGSSPVDIDIQTAEITTSWQKFVFTFDIPSISGKTVGANSALRLTINNINSETHTFDIAQVQVNVGKVALPFNPKSYAEELRDCQRYYIRWANATGYSPHIGIGQVFSATQARCFIALPTTMRIAPSVETSGELRVFCGGGNQRVVSTIGNPSGGLYMPSTKVDLTFATSATDGGAVGFFCSAANSYFSLSAETLGT